MIPDDFQMFQWLSNGLLGALDNFLVWFRKIVFKLVMAATKFGHANIPDDRCYPLIGLFLIFFTWYLAVMAMPLILVYRWRYKALLNHPEIIAEKAEQAAIYEELTRIRDRLHAECLEKFSNETDAYIVSHHRYLEETQELRDKCLDYWMIF